MRLARDNVSTLLQSALADTDDPELWAGISGMDRDELEVFRTEIRRIIALVEQRK